MDREVAPVCYRHSDRETRLSCSNCGKPICFECSNDAAVGQRCPDCSAGAQSTRVVTGREVFSSSWARTPVSYGILATAVAIFVIGLVSQEADSWLVRNFALATFLSDEWWRAFTSALLHANLLHIGFNMYILYLFGPRLEREAGSVPFGLLFLASAAAGSAAFLALTSGPAIAVGASGAIFGLLGVWLVATYKTRHTPAGRAIFQQLLILLLINAAFGFVPNLNIAWEAHAGGFVVGALIGYLWSRYAAGKPNAVAIRSAVAVSVLVVSIALVLVA